MLEPTFSFRNTHCAGRFDQPVATFDKQVRDMQRFSDAVGVTEIDKNARARQLLNPGWKAIWGNKGPRDDCGISVRTTKFKVIYEETYTCSHRQYRNERGRMTDTTEAAFMVVEDVVTKVRVLLGELHTPHGMGPELRVGRVRSDVGYAYVDISKAYLGRARRLMKRFGAKLAALSGDWNLNFRLSWVRTWFRRNFQGWKINWTYLHMTTGTHGREIIDGTLLKGLKPTTRRMLPRVSGDDHSGYTEELVPL